MRSEHQPKIVGVCGCGTPLYLNHDTGKMTAICTCPPNPIKEDSDDLKYLKEMKEKHLAKDYHGVMARINDWIEEMEEEHYETRDI